MLASRGIAPSDRRGNPVRAARREANANSVDETLPENGETQSSTRFSTELERARGHLSPTANCESGSDVRAGPDDEIMHASRRYRANFLFPRRLCFATGPKARSPDTIENVSRPSAGS